MPTTGYLNGKRGWKIMNLETFINIHKDYIDDFIAEEYGAAPDTPVGRKELIWSDPHLRAYAFECGVRDFKFGNDNAGVY